MPAFTTKQKEDAEYLLSLDINELYSEIGKEIRGESMEAAPGDSSRNRILGKDWFQKNTGRLRDTVCPRPEVQALLKSHRQLQKIEIVAILAELLSHGSINFSTLILAVLLTKEGLENFCSAHDH